MYKKKISNRLFQILQDKPGATFTKWVSLELGNQTNIIWRYLKDKRIRERRKWASESYDRDYCKGFLADFDKMTYQDIKEIDFSFSQHDILYLLEEDEGGT